jgi:hypothetical protein
MRDTELRVKLDSAESASLVIDEVYSNDYVLVFEMTDTGSYTYTTDDLRIIHDVRKKIYSFIKGPKHTLTVNFTIQELDDGVLGSAGVTSTIDHDGVKYSNSGLLNLNSTSWSSQVSSVRKDGNSIGYYTLLHEVLHIVGLGTLWGDHLTDGKGYTGTNGLREYRNLMENQTLVAVPLENDGGAGTAGGHIEEGDSSANPIQTIDGILHPALDREVMTGYSETTPNDDEPMILSRISIGMLEDMGLVVDYDGADDTKYPDWNKYNDVYGGYFLPDQTLTTSTGKSTTNDSRMKYSSTTINVDSDVDIMTLSSDGTLMVRYYNVTHTPPGKDTVTTSVYDEFIVTKSKSHDISLGAYTSISSLRLFFKKFSYDYEPTLFSRRCACLRECLPFKIMIP